jgi:hypothetical protein
MALVRTAHGWANDTEGLSIDEPTKADSAAEADRERKIQLAQQGQTSQEMQSVREGDIKAAGTKLQTEAQTQSAAEAASAQRYSADAAARAVIEAARIRASSPRGYAAGGAVKNDHPFNKSFDNKLLMKGRR